MNAALQPAAGRIILDEAPEVYYQRVLGVANNTGLTVIDERSPAHYYYWATSRANDDDDATAALTFGKAFHCATLEPDVFARTYAVLPPDAPARPTAAMLNAKNPSPSSLERQDWWRRWESDNRGRIVLPAKDYDLAQAMSASLRAYVMTFPGNVTMTGAELFDACKKEVTIRWVDEDTGLECKARADIWLEELDFAGDLKSARDGSREAFSRAIHQHRYHVQHCHYADGFRTCGRPLRSFGFFPVEKDAPHVPASWHIDAVSEERGWAIRQRAMRKLKECMDSGRWPGHTSTVEQIGIPAYGHYDVKD